MVDVAGCMLGSVDPAHVLDGSAVRAGDVLLGLGSNGLHTNGFSLARRLVARAGLAPGAVLPGSTGTVIDALLEPHRWYGPGVLPLLDGGSFHALAHVTGGGIAGNLVRVLPVGTRAVVRSRAWEWPALFRWLVTVGDVPLDDARSSFNLGIGMIGVCAPERSSFVIEALEQAGERVVEIGSIVAGTRGVEWSE